MEGIVEVHVRMDEVVEDEGIELGFVVAAHRLRELDGKIITLLIVVKPALKGLPEGQRIDGAGEDKEHNKKLTEAFFPRKKNAGENSRGHENDPHEEYDAPRAHPGDEEETGGKGTDNRAQGRNRVDLSDDIPCFIEVMKGELHDHGRDSARIQPGMKKMILVTVKMRHMREKGNRYAATKFVRG